MEKSANILIVKRNSQKEDPLQWRLLEQQQVRMVLHLQALEWLIQCRTACQILLGSGRDLPAAVPSGTALDQYHHA